MSRARRSALAVLVLLLCMPAVARAQEEPAAGTIRLVSQTVWRSGADPVDIRVKVDTGAPVETLELAVTVSRRLTSRSEFSMHLAGQLRTSVVGLTTAPLAEVPADADGVRTLTVVPPFEREGVYPFRIELREAGGGQALAGFITHVVQLPAVIEGEALRAGIVLPIHERPSVQPTGKVALPEGATTRIGAITSALAAQPDLPVTLQPTPETLDALAETQVPMIEALRGAVGSRRVLAAHYVPTNLVALLRGGLDAEADRELLAGQAAVERHLGTQAERRIRVVDERLDGPALEHLQRWPVEKHVVPEALLAPVRLPTTLTAPFELDVAGKRVPAVMADSALAAHLTEDTDDPVLAAHHLVTDLAVLYFDHPGRSAGVVVAPGRSWSPNRAALTAMFDALASSPIVRAAQLDEVFAVPAATDARRRPLGRTIASGAEPGPLPAADVRIARRRVDGFGSATAPASPVVARLGRSLLVSLSSDLRVRERAAHIEGVGKQLDGELAHIRLPRSRSFTLTGRDGEIPITIRNDAGYPIKARLVISGSDALRFRGDDARDVDLSLERVNTTHRVELTALTSGSFDVTVRLLSPDGALDLGPENGTKYRVRSTATSFVGIALSAAAGVFLVIWWANHLRRRSPKLVGV